MEYNEKYNDTGLEVVIGTLYGIVRVYEAGARARERERRPGPTLTARESLLLLVV